MPKRWRPQRQQTKALRLVFCAILLTGVFLELWRRHSIAVGHKEGHEAEALAPLITHQANAATLEPEMEVMDLDRCRRAAKRLDPELMKPVPDAFDAGYRSVPPALG